MWGQRNEFLFLSIVLIVGSCHCECSWAPTQHSLDKSRQRPGIKFMAQRHDHAPVAQPKPKSAHKHSYTQYIYYVLTEMLFYLQSGDIILKFSLCRLHLHDSWARPQGQAKQSQACRSDLAQVITPPVIT